MQVTCLARARAFTEHSLSLGRGGRRAPSGVAGSKRGKPEDEDTESETDLATVQKGPNYFVLYCHMHIFATMLHVSHMLHY